MGRCLNNTLPIFLILCLCAGCGFLQQRLFDAADIVRFDLGVAAGLGAQVMVTRVCPLGFIWVHDGYYLQMLGPRTGLWRLREEFAWGTAFILPMLSITWRNELPVFFIGKAFITSEKGFGFYFSPFGKMDCADSSIPFRTLPRHTNATAFECGVCVVCGIYFRLSFCPLEFVDFLLGWLGIDIMGDDKPESILATPLNFINGCGGRCDSVAVTD